MPQANEAFDTSNAAKTGSGPTFLVAVEQYEPPGRRIIDDELAAKVLPGGARLFIKLLRIPLLRKWMIKLFEKQIEGGVERLLMS